MNKILAALALVVALMGTFSSPASAGSPYESTPASRAAAEAAYEAATKRDAERNARARESCKADSQCVTDVLNYWEDMADFACNEEPRWKECKTVTKIYLKEIKELVGADVASGTAKHLESAWDLPDGYLE
jgi:hypothetical protein